MFSAFGLELTNEQLFQVLTLVLGVVVLVAIIVLSIVFFKKHKKTPEQKHAQEIAKKVLLLHEGKIQPKKQEQKLAIKKGETSLKSLLIKKYKPKIESQLGSGVEVLDFNAREANFLVLVEVAGAKLLLKLDASGNILDYEKPKKK
jgi:preprotein translocase subunit SecG